MPPVKPMLARSAERIPTGMQYEAKWDGFRCVVFRDGDEVELGSRTTKSLTRYFPELLVALRARLPERCVLDGEIVIARQGALDFDALQERIHPAASRVRKLAGEIPAAFVAFDLLALGQQRWLEAPLQERRAALEDALSGTADPVFLAPATYDIEVARSWFGQFEGAGLDGVVAKPPQLPYRPGERVMTKVKHERTADCVVAGMRMHKSGEGVGSLLLGLYDADGTLQYVGACGAFSDRKRRQLRTDLEPLLADPAHHPWADWQDAAAHETARLPGAPHRWSSGKDQSWLPLRPELVCEVAFDHLQGDRFRHTTVFRRWRPDRAPEDCGYAQLSEPVSYDVAAALTGADNSRPSGGSSR